MQRETFERSLCAANLYSLNIQRVSIAFLRTFYAWKFSHDAKAKLILEIRVLFLYSSMDKHGALLDLSNSV